MSLGQSRPEMNNVNDQEAVFVNRKQFHRILIRRKFRESLPPHIRKPYMHESRSNHAKARLRAPGGRFLSADEIATMKGRETGMLTSGINNKRNINFVDFGGQ